MFYHLPLISCFTCLSDPCDVEYLDECIFDLSKAFHGDIDDEGKPIVEEEEEEEKKTEEGKEKPQFVLSCYSVKMRD